jgi:hypothetical protein
MVCEPCRWLCVSHQRHCAFAEMLVVETSSAASARFSCKATPATEARRAFYTGGMSGIISWHRRSSLTLRQGRILSMQRVYYWGIVVAVGVVIGLGVMIGLRQLHSPEAADSANSAAFLQQHWRVPIPLQGTPPTTYSPIEASLHPKDCGVCHPQQYQDWQRDGPRHCHPLCHLPYPTE